MSSDAIWITEAEVVQLMDLKEAITALEEACARTRAAKPRT